MYVRPTKVELNAMNSEQLVQALYELSDAIPEGRDWEFLNEVVCEALELGRWRDYAPNRYKGFAKTLWYVAYDIGLRQAGCML